MKTDHHNADDVVYNYAKILNLKQFTTKLHQFVKSKNVVYNYAKILNLKQFTTKYVYLCTVIKLSITMQRY